MARTIPEDNVRQDDIPVEDLVQHGSPTYRMYPIRWLVLLTIFFFNLSNNLLWISFSAVSTTAADYYGKSIDDIDWLSSIGFFVGIPTVLIGSWGIDRYGLRICSGIGITLTFIAGLIRMVTAIPGISESMGRNEQFWLCFTAQLLNGLGNPLAVSIPTKVSQNWFSGVQRVMATTILAMSSPVGVMLASAITPLLVKEDPNNIPFQNWLYSIPSSITMVMFILFVRTSVPPTPPSKSAEENVLKRPYLQCVKELFTNKSYVAMFISFGALIGFFNCYATQMEQFLCSRGYSNEFSGLAVTLLITVGLVGSIIAGIMSDITGKLEEIAKICNSLACLTLVLGLLQILRKSELEVAIGILASMYGLFAFGYYGIGFELSVEATYPIDEGMGTAFLFFSGQVQGALLLLLSGAFEDIWSLTPEVLDNSTCKEYAKDHTIFFLFTACYMTIMNVIFVLFVNPEYKRSLANEKTKEEDTDS